MVSSFLNIIDYQIGCCQISLLEIFKLFFLYLKKKTVQIESILNIFLANILWTEIWLHLSLKHILNMHFLWIYFSKIDIAINHGCILLGFQIHLIQNEFKEESFIYQHTKNRHSTFKIEWWRAFDGNIEIIDKWKPLKFFHGNELQCITIITIIENDYIVILF